MQNSLVQSRQHKQIQTYKPFEFDEYLFDNWKAPVGNWYNDFHITRIEEYTSHLKLPIPPHRRSVFFFVYLTNGSFVRTKFLNKYEVLPKDFFFLPADTITTLESFAPDTTGFYCHFKDNIFQHPLLHTGTINHFPFFRLDSEPIITIRDEERILQILQILEKEYRHPQPNRFSLVPLYLSALFAEIKLVGQGIPTEQTTKNSATQLTIRYKNALSTFIYEKSQIQEFADLLHVTSNHLNKSVKSVTGKSAQDLLSEMKILESKVLLKQSNLSIGEIAFKLGKMDQSSFSRFFKSKTNLSPNKYRKSENTL